MNENKPKIKLNKTFAATLLFLAGFILASTSCKREEKKIFFQVSKDTVSVYGYVKDYAGNPIADAEITILPTGDKIKSEKDGLYRFSVGLGELPQDAVITYEVQKGGFVKSRVSVSFAEILIGTNNDVAVQKRVKRQDVVLYPPAEIEVEVVDKDNKPVAGSRVLALPSPQIALYLGVSQNEAVASVTSQTTPVKITSVIPAIDFIQLVAFPPQGAEEDYNVSQVFVDVSQIKAKGKIVLTLKPLEIIYSSVAVGQYISPDDKIKLIFSKEITGIDAALICGPNNINISAKISGTEVEIEPAGRILGNCQLQVNNAFGKKGETLSGIFTFSFIAYDPTAPRGLACPKINPYLPGSVTAVTFDFDVIANRTRAVYYYPAEESFNGFQTTTNNLVTLIWDPPVVSGIKDYKIKYLKVSDKLKGSGIWQELPPPAVQTQFIPTANKWGTLLNLDLIPQFNTSFGEKYYLAVVPVNLNDEEICNPETIENPFIIQDNTSPKITQCQIIAGGTNYGAGERTVQIQFSEMLTSATATISSRNFDAVKISEVFDPLANPFVLRIRVYLEALSSSIANLSDNADGDKKLVLTKSEAKKLWAGERVIISNASVTDFVFSPPPLSVTAIVPIPNTDFYEVWFSKNIVGQLLGDTNFKNGYIFPDPVTSLQAPNNRTLQVEDAAAKRINVSDSTGLTIEDKIQVVDPYNNTRKILTITSVDWNNDIITVSEDISDLKCVATTGKQCKFRSLSPDVWVKVQAFDSSGNLIDSLADQCSVGPVPPVIW
ncbi:MAG: hypothetical protein RRA63_02380 [Candidatus Calescibacterium sp.]|jgi:hypothetical protein|nr:hypothetical protein [Candidatus Calescibacterium sp.]